MKCIYLFIHTNISCHPSTQLVDSHEMAWSQNEHFSEENNYLGGTNRVCGGTAAPTCCCVGSSTRCRWFSGGSPRGPTMASPRCASSRIPFLVTAWIQVLSSTHVVPWAHVTVVICMCTVADSCMHWINLNDVSVCFFLLKYLFGGSTLHEIFSLAKW